MKYKKQFFIIIAIIFLIPILIICNAVYCSVHIDKTHYSIKTDKINTDLHFVFISDLHNKEFGKNNENLVEKIKQENPDFIAVGGDMVIRYFDDDSIMKELLTELSEIAPTYCVLGNHERDLQDKIDFKADITSTGAVLLDNATIRFKKDGETVLIGGLTDYPYYEYDAPDYNNDNRYYWEEFKDESKHNFVVLLHHQPEYIKDMVTDSDVDLVLCGHTHGGLIRIPFVGGLFAPNQGFFPTYDKGEFKFGGTTMIISSGLGISNPIPRINNCAEIAVIDVN